MASSVKKSSFEVIKVTKRESLKNVISKSGNAFAKGKAFYEFTKGEVIQDYKKIVVMRKSDGQFITGEPVRDILKIPKNLGKKKYNLDLEELPDFKVFIQSTSYNRVVLPDSEVLYMTGDDMEVIDTAAPSTSAAAAPAATGRTTRKRGTAAAAKAADTPSTSDATPAKKTKKGAAKGAAADKEDAKDAAKGVAAAASTSGGASSGGAKNGKVDIVFSFDTTGSMYACLGEVRRKIQETITRLQRDIPDIRIAVIAHGDYCDMMYGYITKHIDFTTKGADLAKFVREVGATGGGDFDECYELVLREAYTKLSWRKDADMKSLVMIGDATPHEPNYPLNTDNINWRDECTQLKKNNIKVYAVQALNRGGSTSFYRDVANRTDGFHLMLDQFSSIVNFMLAICYREQGPDQLQQFEDEVRNRGMNRELHGLFDRLAGRTTTFTGNTGAHGLTPIDPSRFQVLHVDQKCSIKEFVQRNSLLFKAGRGFYEFTKPEVISHKKEVVLVDKVTGDMFTGQEACDLIGAGGSARIKPTALEKWRVFVQSTSYNRALVADTGFLYEVDTDH